jgi:hypothetical protein
LGLGLNCAIIIKNRSQTSHIHKREDQDEFYQIPKGNVGLFRGLEKFRDLRKI